jgi:hypothetical protein
MIDLALAEILAASPDRTDAAAFMRLVVHMARGPMVYRDAAGREFTLEPNQYVSTRSGFARLWGDELEKARARLDRFVRWGLVVKETVWPDGTKPEHQTRPQANTKLTLCNTRVFRARTPDQHQPNTNPIYIDSSLPPPPCGEQPRVAQVQEVAPLKPVPLPDAFVPTQAYRDDWQAQHPDLDLDLYAAHVISTQRSRGITTVIDLGKLIHGYARHETDRGRFSHDQRTAGAATGADPASRPAAAGAGKAPRPGTPEFNSSRREERRRILRASAGRLRAKRHGSGDHESVDSAADCVTAYRDGDGTGGSGTAYSF